MNKSAFDESLDEAVLISELEHLVSVVSAISKTEYHGAVQAFTVRVPAALAAQINTMATHGKVSRNEFVCQLLEFAVHEVYDNLSDEVKANLAAILSKELDLVLAEKESVK